MEDLPAYWKKSDVTAIAKARDYTDLFLIAQRVQKRMPNLPLTQVCGPISTGGQGSIEKNMAQLDWAILRLKEIEEKENIPSCVFDQRHFEKPISTILKKRRETGQVTGYDWDILRRFYEPLFEMGRVQTLVFLPKWRSSKGANWEHEYGVRKGWKLLYLPNNWPISIKSMRALEGCTQSRL
ncbi:MAG: hypothetical protein WC045_01825 [Patescibacteria group bacterium]